MKILDYDKVNGTGDRDDTILVAQIINRSATSGSSSSTDHTTVTADENSSGVATKNIVVTKTQFSSGPLSPAMEAGPSRGNGLV